MQNKVPMIRIPECQEWSDLPESQRTRGLLLCAWFWLLHSFWKTQSHTGFPVWKFGYLLGYTRQEPEHHTSPDLGQYKCHSFSDNCRCNLGFSDLRLCETPRAGY